MLAPETTSDLVSKAHMAKLGASGPSLVRTATNGRMLGALIQSQSQRLITCPKWYDGGTDLPFTIETMAMLLNTPVGWT